MIFDLDHDVEARFLQERAFFNTPTFLSLPTGSLSRSEPTPWDGCRVQTPSSVFRFSLGDIEARAERARAALRNSAGRFELSITAHSNFAARR